MSEPTHWASSSMTNLLPCARATFTKSYRSPPLVLRDLPLYEVKGPWKYSPTSNFDVG